MKRSVDLYDFRKAFEDMGRCKNFSWEGLAVLFYYFENLEEEIGEEIELDVIGICCDFSEYESIDEFQHEYGKEYETIDDIANATTVIPIDENAFIIQSF